MEREREAWQGGVLMATGGIALDLSGNIILDAAGNIILDDCCCQCETCQGGTYFSENCHVVLNIIIHHTVYGDIPATLILGYLGGPDTDWVNEIMVGPNLPVFDLACGRDDVPGILDWSIDVLGLDGGGGPLHTYFAISGLTCCPKAGEYLPVVPGTVTSITVSAP